MKLFISLIAGVLIVIGIVALDRIKPSAPKVSSTITEFEVVPSDKKPSQVTSIFDKFESVVGPGHAYDFLKEHVEISRDGGPYLDRASLILLCDRLAAKYPVMAPSALELKALCYGLSNQPEKEYSTRVELAHVVHSQTLIDCRERGVSEIEAVKIANEKAAFAFEREIQYLIGNRQNIKAIKHFDFLVAEYPESTATKRNYRMMAQCAWDNKDVKAASAFLEQSIHANAGSSNLVVQDYDLLSRILRDNQDYTAAESTLEKMLEVSPNDERVQALVVYRKAEIMQALDPKSAEKAIQNFKKVIETYPNSSFATDAKNRIDFINLTNVHGKTVKPPKPPDKNKEK